MVIVVLIFLSTAVNGGMAAVFPAGGVDSSSCGSAGELDSSNLISSICHATSSVVPFIGSNDLYTGTTSTPVRRTKVWA